nr:unnamed protein product [Callosobruchus analis]
MSKQKISYEKYRQVVEKLNTDFDHPSKDACGVCCKFELHNKETAADLSHNSVICESCIRCNAHKAHYTSSRHAYKEDKEHWGPQNIIVKYFEPGHSFMKADSVHGQIGRQWRKRSHILDFNDFSDVVNTSATKNKPIVLHHDYFYPVSDGSKQRRRNITGETNIPLLEQIKIAEFRNGSRSLLYKRSFCDPEYDEVSFLKNKFDINQQPTPYRSDRGVNSAKKAKIIKELCASLESRKQLFWRQ